MRWPILWKAAAEAVSRILSAFAPRLAAGASAVTIIPLAPPSLAGSSRPTRRLRTGRPSGFAACLPIWSCSVRGFACHPCYHGRGALLPHLFTLTRLAPLRASAAAFDLPRTRTRRRAVYFLCHFPSGCPDRALPGALPCGVRTFLPSTRFAAASAQRSSGCTAAIVWLAAANARICSRSSTRSHRPSASSYPSVSCEIWYCSSFL